MGSLTAFWFFFNRYFFRSKTVNMPDCGGFRTFRLLGFFLLMYLGFCCQIYIWRQARWGTWNNARNRPNWALQSQLPIHFQCQCRSMAQELTVVLDIGTSCNWYVCPFSDKLWLSFGSILFVSDTVHGGFPWKPSRVWTRVCWICTTCSDCCLYAHYLCCRLSALPSSTRCVKL